MPKPYNRCTAMQPPNQHMYAFIMQISASTAL